MHTLSFLWMPLHRRPEFHPPGFCCHPEWAAEAVWRGFRKRRLPDDAEPGTRVSRQLGNSETQTAVASETSQTLHAASETGSAPALTALTAVTPEDAPARDRDGRNLGSGNCGKCGNSRTGGLTQPIRRTRPSRSRAPPRRPACAASPRRPLRRAAVPWQSARSSSHDPC
jgi:hypothetical protein